MERLTGAQVADLLEFLLSVYSARSVEDFVGRVLAALPRLIGNELTTYHEMSLSTRRSRNWTNPAGVDTQEIGQTWTEVMREHPVLRYQDRTGDGQALCVSDFLTRTQLQGLRLYADLWRVLGIDEGLCTALQVARPLVVGLGLHRRRATFTQRERQMLNLLRPHLAQARRAAATFEFLSREFDELDRGVVVVDDETRVGFATRLAHDLVAEYFGRPLGCPPRLPDELTRWVGHQRRLFERTDVPPPRTPLVVSGAEGQLVVWLRQEAGQILLFFERQPTGPARPGAKAFGLTPREAEILEWVAQGKTDAVIGAILGISPRTVGKHLERSYQKLGVETRTAAAARWLSFRPERLAPPRETAAIGGAAASAGRRQ